MLNQIIKQFNINQNNPKSRPLLEELVEKVKNIAFFKLQNCRFCTNRICLMLKKECLFYDRITGQNYQFFKCKYFKRAYIRAENEQITKSFQNMLNHLFLKSSFNKDKIKFEIDGAKINFHLDTSPCPEQSFGQAVLAHALPS